MRLILLALGIGLGVSGWSGSPSPGGAVREQVIALRPGWNAVFLEVKPLEVTPSQLFVGTPVDVITAFFPQTHPTAYVHQPGDAPWREEGWGVWYAPDRVEAVLNSLHAIDGQRAYLVHATREHQWRVRGRVALRPVRWQPDSYNFVGFTLDPQSPPTFASFFAPSRAHRGQRVYRLVDDLWTPVRDPAQTRMRAGEAYWVYAVGGSDYQGPLQVRLLSGDTLDLGRKTRDGRIELKNLGAQPAEVVIEPADLVGDPLPLAYLDEDLSRLRTTFPAFPSRLELPSLAAGSTRILRVAARRELMTSPIQSTLLRISNGAGVHIWLPVMAERPN